MAPDIDLELDSGGPFAPDAVVVDRQAARAVVVDGRGRLLLMRSRHGDYKFPGGGLESAEAPEQALLRELAEECGVTRAEVVSQVLCVRERRPAAEPGAVFSMTSRYYLCRLAGDVGETAARLEPYELALELRATWVGLAEARDANTRLLARWRPEEVAARAPWLPRETAVLVALGDGDGGRRTTEHA